jgi:predicted transcriptional regulator of viral defense system
MLFLNFKNVFSPFLVFSITDIEKRYPDFNKMNLVNWQKKGYIIKLRNSLYMFADQNPDDYLLYFLGNKLYSPSYIGLESALSFHGLIPEGIFTIRSVTTLKTSTFKAHDVLFYYSKIKASLFFGYTLIQKGTRSICMADIEKSLLDYLYFNPRVNSLSDITALRLNKEILREKCDFNKLADYASVFDSPVLFKRMNILNSYIHD